MAPRPPAALAQYLSEGRCVLFVGAGLSMWAGMPSWGGLLERLSEEATEGDPDGEAAHELARLREDGAYLQVGEYCREQLGEFRFLELLRSTLRPTSREVPAPHRLLVDLPFAGIVTTNYDPLIETAFERLGRSRPRVLTHEDTTGLGSLLFDRRPFVLKAHGDLDRPATLVLTARDYREVIHANPAFAEVFSAILLTHSILFLGYSLSDPDFRLLMDQQLTLFDGNVPPRYALMSGLGRIEREVLWKSAAIQVLSYAVEEDHPDGSHHQLLRFLEALAERVAPPQVVDALPAGSILLSSSGTRGAGTLGAGPPIFDENELRAALDELRQRAGDPDFPGPLDAESEGQLGRVADDEPDLSEPSLPGDTAERTSRPLHERVRETQGELGQPQRGGVLVPDSAREKVQHVDVVSVEGDEPIDLLITRGRKGRNVILEKKFGAPAMSSRETPHGGLDSDRDDDLGLGGATRGRRRAARRSTPAAVLSLGLEQDRLISRLAAASRASGGASLAEAVSGEVPARRLERRGRFAANLERAIDWSSGAGGRAVREAGEALGELLAPAVRRGLDLLDEGTQLRLEIAPGIERWPWEWVRLDGDERPLALRFALARAPVDSSDSMRGRPAVDGPPSVLFVADPSSNLPGARDEAEAVADAYLEHGARHRVLAGDEATTTAVLSLLQHEPWDVVHFAGHGWFDEQQAYLLLAGGERLRVGELRFFLGRRPPALLVLNTHFSAFLPPRVSATLEGAEGSAEIAGDRRGRDGFSETALAAGVGAVVGTFGSVSDAVAAEIGGALHRCLLDGLALAEALRRARPAAPPGDADDPSGLFYALSGYGDLRWPKSWPAG